MGEIRTERKIFLKTLEKAFSNSIISPSSTSPWKGGRVVECTALERRHTVIRIEGSNPSPSAKTLSHDVLKRRGIFVFIRNFPYISTGSFVSSRFTSSHTSAYRLVYKLVGK